MPARFTIKDMQVWASDKGGKCLSKHYWSTEKKLTWMCAKAHTWDAFPSVISQGSWCPTCSGKRKGTIEGMRAIAQERGGLCLSKIYIHKDIKLDWQCKNRHFWKSTANSVKRGSWCPYCYGNVKHTVLEMQQIAKSRGGKFLSKKYINKETPHKWKCDEGHVWNATPGSITHQKSWCPICARKRMGNKGNKYTIEDMRRIAKERKGKCLSKKYINVDTVLRWKCARGHIWYARPIQVRNHNSWCGKCRYIDKSTKHKYHLK